MLNRQISLAASVGVTLTVLTTLFQVKALADPPPVQSGTYYNTPGSQTTFTNGNQTGSAPQNSGAVHFTAPGQVVRLDGNINTAAVSQSNGYTGNGGTTSFTPPINSVNNGAIAQGGTYFNTADSKTTFTNTSGGGVWLQSGSNLRGLEVDALGKLTNNGGTIHFYAPGAVVRLDGNIDVRAVRAGSEGSYLGNGGKLFVDSAFLYQNGNIYANGINGGLVQFNVGAATFGGNSRIETKGFEGAGGVIAINASGPVNVGRQTVLDSSGKVAGSIDTNLINIEGGLVNVAGNLFANGIESRGGTIRIVATGQSDLSQTSEALAQAVTAGNFTEGEKNNIEAGLLALKNAHDGDIVIASASGEHGQANVYANGYSGAALTSGLFPEPTSGNDPTDPTERAGDGGTVLLTAQKNIENGGWVLANGGKGNPYVVDISNPNSFTNGGHGGTVSLIAGNNITNTGRIVTDGGFGGISVDTDALHGGNGGLMAFSYSNLMNNAGVIRGHGGAGAMKPAVPTQYGRNGAGGLAVFSGTQNLSGNGLVSVLGAPSQASESPAGKLGTIVAPDPATSTNTLIGIWRKTQPVELLTHAENLIFLTKNGGSTPISANVFDRLLQASIRSVGDPSGALGQARAEVISKNTGSSAYVFRNLILSSNRDGLEMALSHPYKQELPGVEGAELILPSPLSNGQGFTTLNTLSVINDGPVSTQNFPGPNDDFPSTPIDMWLISRNSNSLGGGRISILANGDISNSNVLGTVGVASGGSVNIATKGTFFNGGGQYGFGGLLSTSGNVHGGSIMAKAGQDIVHNFIHPFSRSSLTANGDMMGGTIRLLAQRDFSYVRTLNDARITANGSLQGGNIEINAGNNSNIALNSSDNFIAIQANGTSPTLGRGGYIHIHGQNDNTVNGIVEATGGLEYGTVSFTTGN